jgi:putative transposase
MEDVLRKTAIRRYVLGGESPKAIYNSLNRSKKWFFKWLKRYQTGGMDWYKDKKCSGVSLKEPQKFDDKGEGARIPKNRAFQETMHYAL